ncbi:MAG: DUF5723 family protein, partial [Cyclobacteriaceae bacterium]|nr:DUF5723 family protein [Cyclobacteriaceae bacterium]
DETGVNQMDIQNALNKLTINNLVSTNVNVNLFHFGYRFYKGSAFSVFANERVEVDVTYPKSLLEWFWNGNGTFIGQTVDVRKFGVSSNYFREYGIGYASPVPEEGLTYGFRLKYYQGMANASTPASLNARVLTENENFQFNMQTHNTILRTSGLGSVTKNPIPYLLFNGNRGIGLDAGLEYQFAPNYSFALAVTDVGYISWKEDIKNYQFNDTTMRYTGIQLRGVKNLVPTVQDTLLDKFVINRNNDRYIAPMVGKVTGSFVFTPKEGLDIISSMHSRIVQGQLKSAFGVGVRRFLGPKFIASASVTKLPQQFINLGAGLTATAGIVQFYVSTDKVVGYSVPDMNWAEARIGINLVFGSGRKDQKSNEFNEYEEFNAVKTLPKGVVSHTFLGKKIKVKSHEGLYTTIRKVERNDGESITPNVQKNNHRKYKTKSATGKVNKSGARARKVKSASGAVNKPQKHKAVHSASSPSNRQHAIKPKKIQSASGSVKNNSRKKSKIRSVSGTKKRFTSRKY